MNPRHSKVVCTIGPATRSPRMIRKLLLAGMDVRKGDMIGIVAGTPMGIRGTTNFMKFHVIGGPS